MQQKNDLIGMFPATLGERIKLILREKALKQKDFAKTLGITANYVYLLTSGKKKTISEPLAKLIESIYGYPSGWILNGDQEDYDRMSRFRLETDIIQKVKLMSYHQLKALSAFIHTMEK